MLVIERLSQPDVNLILHGSDGVDLAALRAKRAALQARLDELAAMFAEGAIDGSQLRRGTSELRVQIASVDGVLADVTRVSPVADLIRDGHGRDRLQQRWDTLTPDIRGKVIEELMTVTVLPAPRGTNGFHPEYVAIDWKASR
jgi:site-specific DNA recombinase